MTNIKAPTKAQLEEGPIVNLHKTEWASEQWDLPGFGYPVAFDADGNTTVLLSEYKEFGDNNARAFGIAADKPAPAKPEAAKHSVKKKPVAKKKPAAKVLKKKK